jgi:hypothetical protein
VATTDYTKSKYQNALTEAAYAVAGEGFASDTSGDLSDGCDWSALVVVDGRCVIIREDAQGFVWTDYAETHHGTDHARIAAAWANRQAEDAAFLDGSDDSAVARMHGAS